MTQRVVRGEVSVRITVGVKMAMGYGLVLIMLGVVLLSGLSGLNQVVHLYESEVLRIAENSRLAQEVAGQVWAASFSVAAFTTTGNPVYRQEFDEADAAATRALDELQGRSVSDGAHALIDRVRTLQTQYMRGARSLFDQFAALDPEEFVDLVGGLDSTRDRLNEAVAELIAYQAQRRQELQHTAEQARAQARRLMVGFTLVALVIGSVSAFLVTRSVAGPAQAVARAAERLAGGDLTLGRLEVRTRDEIGDMAASFNRMVDNLRSMMEAIRQASVELTQSGEQLARMTEETAGATSQIVAAINQVAEGANQQAASSNETMESAEHLRKAIDQIAAGAQNQAQQVQEINSLVQRMSEALAGVAAVAVQVAEDAGRDLESAEAGGEAVRAAVEGMARLQARVQDVAERVHELGRHSQRIGEIVALISDIADQTNLLALNAAIEAARAGEHGRGFAVVADEVRKLAESSAHSARQISELIETIQAGVREAVASVESGTKEAEAGSQLAGQAGEALERIVTSVAKSSENARRIATEAERVTRDSEEIVRSVTEVASIIEENTAATEEMSAASVQVTDAMSAVSSIATETAASVEAVVSSVDQVSANVAQVRDAAAGLTRVAERLSGLVGQFKLPARERGQ